MAFLTKKEFAERTGQKTKNLAVYASRGKVVVGADDLIDTDHPTNQAFIGKHGWKAKQVEEKKPEKVVKPKPAAKERVFTKPKPQKAIISDDDFEDDEEVEIGNIGDVTDELSALAKDTAEAEARYKAARAIKTEQEAGLTKMRVEKVRGSIIPTDIVIPIFVQHNQHILSSQKAADDEILNDLAHRFGIGGDEVAKLRGEWVKRRNEAMKKATEASEKGVDAVVKNFIDTKV